MFSFKKHFKKIIVGSLTVFAISLVAVKPAYAQNAIEDLLQKIWQNTYYILADVNDLPSFIANWINPDNTQTTATLQGYFSAASTGYTDEYKLNAFTTQSQLLKDFFGPKPPDNVNDLSYVSILGGSYVSPDPRKNNNSNIDPAYNYTKNAAGLTITHPVADNTWAGKDEAIKRYMNYYNTVNSVQTFDSWVLGQTYSELKSGFPFAKQQWNLIAQASTSDWFTQVASENIGVVLRQILMYDSQILVALTEMLRVQKEQLQASAMTNTLLVLSNLQNESYLIKDAQGKIPGN